MRGALEDEQLRWVLADWYEERGERRWATMVRDPDRAPLRWTQVRGALKEAGLTLRRRKSRFHWLEDVEPDVGMAALAWRVRDPSWLGPLLATPLWSAVQAVHLEAWRARTAVPQVLCQLASRPLKTLEVVGQPVDPAALPSTLDRLALRLDRGTTPCTLQVTELLLRVRSDADLVRLEKLETPALKTLHLRMVPGRRGLERDVRAALDRELTTITVDRPCAVRFGAALQARAPERLIDVDRRWHRDREDPNRWMVEG